MKKAIIFDFDGTLVDSFNLVNFSILKVVNNHLNIKLKQEDIFKYFGPSEEGILKNIFKDKYLDKYFYEYLDIYLNYHNQYLSNFFPQIENLLRSLNSLNIPLFIVTGRNKETLDITLTKLNAFKYFTKTYTGSINGVNKPSNFKQLLHDFNLSSQDVIYIGDSLKDIESTKEVNIDILSVSYITNRYDELKKINKLTFNEVGSLKEYLLNIVK